MKLLGHMGKVSFKGVVNDELVDIDTDGELLSLCDKVPLSYQRVVLIYAQHTEEEDVTVNKDCEEVGVALNEDSEEEVMDLNEDSEEEGVALNKDIGPVTEDIGSLNNDENRAFIEGSRPLNNDKEGRPFTEDHGSGCTFQDWDSSDDDGPLNNEGNRVDICETDVEDRNENTKEEDKEDDPDFVDSAHELMSRVKMNGGNPKRTISCYDGADPESDIAPISSTLLILWTSSFNFPWSCFDWLLHSLWGIGGFKLGGIGDSWVDVIELIWLCAVVMSSFTFYSSGALPVLLLTAAAFVFLG
ncbi:hypothetical protein L3X38_016638 [Prunus dulcis]|uniref:Uncharacterized protein n=1 Tax=Prunus dulcis TaxID=3755 RepID=A0AAD4W8C2_PRUDU|nr:hypothetical protein L3X38_016638 [Prunus dulcis]